MIKKIIAFTVTTRKNKIRINEGRQRCTTKTEKIFVKNIEDINTCKDIHVHGLEKLKLLKCHYNSKKQLIQHHVHGLKKIKLSKCHYNSRNQWIQHNPYQISNVLFWHNF